MGVSSRIRVMSRVLLLMLAGASAVSLEAQEAKTMLAMPPVPLLPPKFGSWEPVGIAPGSEQFLPDQALLSVLKEDGLERATRQRYYNLPEAKETIQVQAFQFGDASGAYSAYTFLRKPEMHDLPESRRVGAETATTNEGQFLFRSGTTVVLAQVSAVRASTPSELRLLMATLPKIGGTKGLPPLLPTYLPAQGLKRETVKYALGPVGYQAIGGARPPESIGVHKAAEVGTAKDAGKGT